MIIVKFNGGLGNQMYQYIFYLYLKKRWPDVKIKADIERYHYESQKIHNGFELSDVFENIELETATVKEILSGGGEYERQKPGIFDILQKRFYNFIRKKRYAIFEEDWDSFKNIEVDDITNQTYWLYGYWAHIAIKSGMAETVFYFKKQLDQENQKILSKIKVTESVSIHVRRGDYIGTSFDQCDMDYYMRAIHYIENKINNLEWFVFSDDKEYIKENFSFLKNCNIIDWNYGKDSYKDMELMSYCKHNIIANSTFSTWGAILNKNENKIVIMPNGYIDNNTKEKLIGNWVGI